MKVGFVCLKILGAIQMNVVALRKDRIGGYLSRELSSATGAA